MKRVDDSGEMRTRLTADNDAEKPGGGGRFLQLGRPEHGRKVNSARDN